MIAWKDYNLNFFFFFVILAIVVFGGAVSNVANYLDIKEVAGINYGTLLLFMVCGFFLVYGTSGLLNGSLKNVEAAILIVLCLFGIVLGFVYFAIFTTDKVTSIKASATYFFIPFCSIGAYCWSVNSQGQRIGPMDFPVYAAIAFSIIAFVQFLIGYNGSTDWIVLHGEEILGFWQIGWIRPTAWVGNSIFFSGLMCTLFFYSFLYALKLNTKLSVLASIGALVSIYLSMSRYSLIMMVAWIVLIVFLYVVFYPAYKKSKIKILVAIFLPVVIMSGAFTEYNEHYQSSPSESTSAGKRKMLAVDRFNAESIYSKGSNEVHKQETKEAMSKIMKGDTTGWGTQGISAQNGVISDGLWFQIGLEVGMAGSSMFGLWFLMAPSVVLKKLYKIMKNAQMKKSSVSVESNILLFAIFFISVFGYFFVAGFVNTSFSCRINYFFIWFLMGVFFAQTKAFDSKSVVGVSNSF